MASATPADINESTGTAMIEGWTPVSVDMYESRFRTELMKVPAFEPNDVRDPDVWPRPGSSDGEFPAWRALFGSLCLWGHSTGYRLFSFDTFFSYCEKAYTERHPENERFRRYFQAPLRDGMRQRIGVWYESGMAETHLYACLAQALEDESKTGVVLYDPRADWKLKADIVVILNGNAIRVSAYVGDEAERAGIERRRDGIERVRKRNTAKSAHWGNEELGRMPLSEIALTADDMQVVNGCRLFSIAAVNRLLTELYTYAEVQPSKRWTFRAPD
ncbi:hypothetical protein [Nocardia tengchongensis]|uniref:hypothetical protein n=1 Tax=Nocardia tengchongensis TaxID=2055889 RepID=UPI0036A57DE0